GEQSEVPRDDVRIAQTDAVNELPFLLGIPLVVLGGSLDTVLREDERHLLHDQVQLSAKTWLPPVQAPPTSRVEVHQDHEVIQRVHDRQVLENDLVLGLQQEVPDAVVCQV